jgi:hypothetical protein
MIVRNASPSGKSTSSTVLRMPILRALLAGVLGLACALLVSCGASNSKLIPLANAGPLQSDFEEIAQAAQTGSGNCSGTEAAILKTEQDFTALPATIDSGLRNTLRQGIANLRSRALVLCAQPLAGTTATTTTPPKTTTTTPTTPPTTTTTPTVPSTTPTTTTPPGPGGGTPAPGAGEPQPEAGSGQGGGTGAGESGAGGGGAPGAGGKEGGK